MVIDDLDQFGAAIAPDEADAPLIINSDAMLPASVAFECFEAITGRCPQVRKPSGSVEHIELSHGDRSDRVELGDGLALIQRLGAPVSERPYHLDEIECAASYVN